MDRRVRILEDTVVNQIAAGEVVERPASVVKELVENAIDADADDITVVVSGGGRSSIEVIDNGCGMSRENALLAIERFGTSKIRTPDDLTSVGTLGFRGEALPSIASVSRFSLGTRSEEGSGIELRVQGGKLRDVVEKDIPRGTRVSVKNLFFNVPARKKFLRAPNTELGHIRSLLTDMAAAHPKIRLSLVVDGEELEAYPRASDFSERVRQLRLVQGRNILIEHSAGDITVSGVLSEAIEAVSSSARLRLLVNGRSVRDRLLLKAVREGFGAFLKPGRYPTGVLRISMPADELDVNVHPQKTEVRFREPSKVFAAISESISSALSSVQTSTVGPAVSTPAREQPISQRFSFPSANSSAFSSGAFSSGAFSSGGASRSDIQRNEHAEVRFSEEPAAPEALQDLPGSEPVQYKLSDSRYVGQILHLYLLLEGAGRLAIVDMHAAHERVMFFKIKSQLMDGGVAAQGLLVPETVVLPSDRIEQFERHRESLNRLGFDTERFGDDAVIIRSVPALLSGVSAKAMLDDLLALPEWSRMDAAAERLWDAVVSRMACHRSVRSGRDLEREEVYELLEQLEQAERSAFCPHGRPVAVWISADELEQMFGRVHF